MKSTRLEAFSDGVFAIAITLLILEIRLPHSNATLGTELINLWPSYFAYAVSFIVIGAIWINHHAMFDRIARVDQSLLLLNTLHLMFIAFLPFPTAVLADALKSGTDEPLAASFYGGTLTVIGALVTIMWYYAAHKHRLLGEHVSRDAAKKHGRTLLVGPVCYAIATVVAFKAPWVALTAYVCLNVFFLWPRREHTAVAKRH